MPPLTIPGPESVRSVAVARDPGVRANAQQFGAGIGEAMADLGAVAASLGQRLREKHQALEDERFLQRVEIEGNTNAYKTFMDNEPQAIGGPDVFHGLIDSQLERASGEIPEKVIREGGYRPSAEARQRAQGVFSNLRSRYGIMALEAGNNARISKMVGDLETDITSVQASLAQHGDLTAASETVDRLVGTAGQMLAPAETDKLKSAVNAGMSQAVASFLDRLQDKSLEATTEEDWQAYQTQAFATIDQAVAKGYIAAPAGEDAKRNWQIGFGKRLAEKLLPGEVVSMLGGGMSQSAGGTEASARELLYRFEQRDPWLTTHWDTNHHRIGFSSDTITRADGTVKRVQQGDTITREDAERDLTRRIQEAAAQASDTIGNDVWSRWDSASQAAMISVIYNYGRLPANVAAAAKTGDREALAASVGRLTANKSRRRQEAAIIRSGKVEGGGGSAPQSDSILGQLPADVRSQLLESAQSELSRGTGGYEDAAKDYVAYLRNGGAPDPTRYTPETLAATVGPQKGAEIQAEIARAEAYGADVNAIRWASPEELTSMIARRSAALASPEGFRANAQDVAGLTEAIIDRNKRIAADPAAYVADHPKVKAAAEAMAAGEQAGAPQQGTSSYAAASLDRQAFLGIPEEGRRLLTGTQVATISAQFRNQEEGGQNAAQIMQGLQAQWGKHWPMVYRQLVEDGELPGVVAVIGAMDRPNQMRAAEALAEAAQIGRAELEKLVSSENKDTLRDGIMSEIGDFASSLAAVPGGQKNLLMYHDAVELLALGYMSQGDEPGNAASRAYEDVIGKAYQFVEDGPFSYRVPAEYDSAVISAGAAEALDELPPIGLRLPQSLAGLERADTNQAFYQTVRAYGFWQTSPNEEGLTLYVQGAAGPEAVFSNHGFPIQYTWEELQERASQPAEDTTEQDVQVSPDSPDWPASIQPLRPEERDAFDQWLTENGIPGEAFTPLDVQKFRTERIDRGLTEAGTEEPSSRELAPLEEAPGL